MKNFIPNIPIKFDGVNKDTTIGALSLARVPLEEALEFLAMSGEVYFDYNSGGIRVYPETNQD